MEWWLVAVYIIVLVLSMVISSYKWKMLAEFKGIKFPLKYFFNLYLTGTFINNFMPSFVAGDAYKTYKIAGPEKKYMEAASTVMMDRITGLVGAMILALFFSILNYKDLLRSNEMIFFDSIIFLSLFSDIVIMKFKKIPQMRRLALKILPQKAADFMRQLYNFSNNTAIIKKATLWGMVFSIIGIAFLNYLLFWGLGISVNLVGYLSVIFVISIISSIPITINNIGLKEWAYITLFSFFGVSSGAVVAISVISRFLQMLVSFAALPFYLKNKK
jgi:uncharacterized protein (TIRG00374 family)